MPAARPIGISASYVLPHVDTDVTSLDQHGNSVDSTLYDSLFKSNEVRKALHDRMRAACLNLGKKSVAQLKAQKDSFGAQFKTLLELSNLALVAILQLNEDQASRHLRLDGLQKKDFREKVTRMEAWQTQLNNHLTEKWVAATSTLYTYERFCGLVKAREDEEAAEVGEGWQHVTASAIQPGATSSSSSSSLSSSFVLVDS